jgi:hypothetical protein
MVSGSPEERETLSSSSRGLVSNSAGSLHGPQRARPPDEVVGEKGLRNVFAALEPPERSEEFIDVVVVQYSDA